MRREVDHVVVRSPWIAAHWPRAASIPLTRSTYRPSTQTRHSTSSGTDDNTSSRRNNPTLRAVSASTGRVAVSVRIRGRSNQIHLPRHRDVKGAGWSRSSAYCARSGLRRALIVTRRSRSSEHDGFGLAGIDHLECAVDLSLDDPRGLDNVGDPVAIDIDRRRCRRDDRIAGAIGVGVDERHLDVEVVSASSSASEIVSSFVISAPVADGPR